MAKRNYTAAARERGKRNYEKNKEKILARNKQWHADNKDKWHVRQRRDALRKLYGMTLDEYDAMFYEQGGQCAICGSEYIGRKGAKYFNVDHDHKTGVTRGLLCRHCNIGLGSFMDDPEILASAIQYVQQHRMGPPDVGEEGSDSTR